MTFSKGGEGDSQPGSPELWSGKVKGVEDTQVPKDFAASFSSFVHVFERTAGKLPKGITSSFKLGRSGSGSVGVSLFELICKAYVLGVSGPYTKGNMVWVYDAEAIKRLASSPGDGVTHLRTCTCTCTCRTLQKICISPLPIPFKAGG